MPTDEPAWSDITLAVYCERLTSTPRGQLLQPLKIPDHHRAAETYQRHTDQLRTALAAGRRDLVAAILHPDLRRALR